MRKVLKLLGALLIVALVVCAAGAGGALYLLQRYGQGLPDYRQLADYQPPTVTRIHAADGRLLAEYAAEKRVFVPIEAIPKRVIQAFLAAEDKNFYSHPGIDVLSIVRAAVTNIGRLWEDRRPVGASTITQQVAKNFLLTNEVSLERKIKEAILAFRIEHAFTKDQILELYLNEIYLGIGSYGVAAAALNYFDKSLDELTTAEAAFLGGLPKAPSWYNPARQPEAARNRRDWVIGRMLELGFIDREDAEHAWAEPLEMRKRAPTEIFTADYFTEEVRRELVQRYGESALYQGGLSIRTTLQPELQAIVQRALRDGLMAYDQRHGWRGPEAELPLDGAWPTELAALEVHDGLESWRLALVLETGPEAAVVGFADGSQGTLPFTTMRWARKVDEAGNLGPVPSRPDQVVQPGDVIWVAAEEAPQDAQGAPGAGARYALRQAPEVEGAVVALDPHNGRVLAMSGGFSYGRTEFNRATQARRQPGSALKPFVYLAALADGFTPSSIILDAPLVIDQGPELGKWKPANYSRRFYGPSTLRLGLEKSRNVMTVRLAKAIGMDRVVDMAGRFGLAEGMGHNLASALGSNEVTLLQLTTAYAELVNGGKHIEPALIERMQDRHGRTVMRRDQRPCPDCQDVAWHGQPAPELVDQRAQVIPAPLAYQMVNLLQGVVERGTGVRARSIGKPVAGKTGTSDDSRDAWFIGFTPDLVVGVYVGYDQPRSLGDREQGATAALPIFVDIMDEALKNKPATPFRVPPGVRLVRVDADSGLLPGPGTDDVILEAFLPGTEPTEASVPGRPSLSVTDGFEGVPATGSVPPRRTPRGVPHTGGLY
ncbi:MAG: penicillin-binding protein 1A [Geminicoccaceae bacterium]